MSSSERRWGEMLRDQTHSVPSVEGMSDEDEDLETKFWSVLIVAKLRRSLLTMASKALEAALLKMNESPIKIV